jgi:hypothetical protein
MIVSKLGSLYNIINQNENKHNLLSYFSKAHSLWVRDQKKYYIYHFLELYHEIWKFPIFSVIYEKNILRVEKLLWQ